MRFFVLAMTIVLFGCNQAPPASTTPATPTLASVPEVATPTDTTPPKAAHPADFQDYSWGTPQADISGARGTEARVGSSVMAVMSTEDCTVAGLECEVVYYFLNGGLAQGRFVISQRHSNLTSYVWDFKDLETKLTEKYGKPLDRKVLWMNDLYKDDPAHWGMAVAAGHLVMLVKWETPLTRVQLGIAGDNYQIQLVVQYDSLARMAEMDRAFREVSNSGL